MERCENGIERATKERDHAVGQRLYYQECAGVYAEPACREAFAKAGDVPADERLASFAEPCRRAYCPFLAERGELAACEAGFHATPDTLRMTWPKLHEAILRNDARGLAPRLTRAMLGFYVLSTNWTPPKPEPPAPSPSPKDGAAPPASPASAAPSAP